MNQKLLEWIKVTVWICFWVSKDIRGKLASQNLGNSIIWTPRKAFIRIIYESKVAWIGQSDSLDLFLMSTDIKGMLASQNLGNSIIWTPRKLFMRILYYSKVTFPQTSRTSWPARTWGTASSGVWTPRNCLSVYYFILWTKGAWSRTRGRGPKGPEPRVK